MPGGAPKDFGPNVRKRRSMDANFGLPSPGQVVKKLTSAKPSGGVKGMGSGAAAAPAPKPKAPKMAKPAANIGKMADRAFKSQERDEKYRKSREQLGNFYLQSAGGYGSDWFSKKKK